MYVLDIITHRLAYSVVVLKLRNINDFFVIDVIEVKNQVLEPDLRVSKYIYTSYHYIMISKINLDFFRSIICKNNAHKSISKLSFFLEQNTNLFTLCYHFQT